MPILVAPPTFDGGVGPGVPGDGLQPRSASLGATVFGAADPYGTLVYLTDVKGWYGATGTTGTVSQRASDHGGWADPAYLPPRVIELSLTLVGSAFSTVEQSCELITGALPLSTLQTLMLISPDGSARQADVRQNGDVFTTQKGATAVMSVSLIAPDPRRYSIELTTAQTGLPQTSGGLSLPISLPVSIGATMDSGVLTVVNAGNVSTRPVFQVVGPAPAGSIVHRATGRTLTWHDPIGAGRTLVINTDQRRALLDGTANRVVTGTWFDYDPGVNEVAFTAATYDAAALLVSSHRSAWR